MKASDVRVNESIQRIESLFSKQIEEMNIAIDNATDEGLFECEFLGIPPQLERYFNHFGFSIFTYDSTEYIDDKAVVWMKSIIRW